jgi:GNAT superfamily N-acetyltransferase
MPVDADARAVGEVHLRAWLETYPCTELGIDEAWIEQNVSFVDTPEGTAFRAALFAEQRLAPEQLLYRVVVEGGAIVGFLHAHVESDDTVTLDAIYLLDRVKGSGVADELMALLFEWAGRRCMHLDVASYNARAIRFYQRHGFALISGERLWLDRVPIQAMRRDLDAS